MSRVVLTNALFVLGDPPRFLKTGGGAKTAILVKIFGKILIWRLTITQLRNVEKNKQ